MKAAVLGTGMMGPGIAATLALGGVPATLVGRTAASAERGLEKARQAAGLLQQHGLARGEAAALDAGSDLDASVAGADFVFESFPEDMELKQALFAHLDTVARPEAVLASNTSGLSITAVAARCARPGRVLTAHFWNPPHLMPLVEIVKGERTEDAAIATVRGLLAACGKTPVVIRKDRPGQLGNRLQHAMWREAVNIVAEGIADPEDVDLAAKLGFGLRLPVYGIFEHADAVGLDMVFAIMDYIARDLYNRPQAPDLLKQLTEAGELGAKTGRGFYDWSKKDLAAVIDRRDRFVLDFLSRWR